MAEKTRDDKVVLLLQSLTPQAAEPILARMESGDAARIRARLSKQQAPTSEELHEAAREFQDLLRIAERSPPSPPQPAETPATTSHEQVPSEPTSTPQPEPIADPVAALREIDPEMIAGALREERAATVAIVLSVLDVQHAGLVLKLLPAEIRHEAVARQCQPVPQNQDLVRRILLAIVERCRQTVDVPLKPSTDQLATRMADLVRALGREDRRQIVGRLELTDPEMAEKVRKMMYRFADVLKVDDRTLQGILGELNISTLSISLKGADEDVKNKLLNNISKRARENVLEEMELLGSVQPAQIEEAQSAVVQVLQQLDEEGKLTL
jgi:flagellar motor switch protein FliG